MLNFYNYYGKIHPELVNRLKELDRKLNLLGQATNDTLIIRVSLNDFEEDENMFAKGLTFLKESFGANSTIKLTEDIALSVLRDVKVIIVYYGYNCTLLYKKVSNAEDGTAYFGEEYDGIELKNNTLIRKLPS